MFERREDLQIMVDALVALCGPLNRGELLTREAIAGVLGVEPNTGHWGHCVRRARRRVERDRGIATWPVTNHGFRLLTTDEQINLLPRLRRRKAFRQIRRSQRSVAALPAGDLTLHQQVAKANQLAGLRRTEQALRSEIEAAEVMARPTETLPRARPIPRPERGAVA